MSISTLENLQSARMLESAQQSPSFFDVEEAVGAAASDFDSGELGDVCAIAFENIADLIAAKDAKALGEYIMFLRRQRIADLASRRLYGRAGEILASRVTV